MDGILYIRAIIISAAKKYEAVLLFIARFLLGLFIYSNINKLGFLRSELLFIITPPAGFVLLLILAFLFAALPLSASYAIISFYAALHLSANLEIAVTVFLCLLCLIFFYVRLAPKENILILVAILGFYFKIPYFTPMFAGLYFGLTSAVPIMIGVLVWHFIPVVTELLKVSDSAGLDITAMADTIPDIYQNLFANLSGDTQWIFTAFSFTMIIITVFAISKLSVDFSAEIAILFGAAVNIVSVIAADIVIKLDKNIIAVLLSTAASAALLLIVRFFDIALDYSRVERVQFSDEDNYYYVKVVPKLLTSAGQKEKRAAGRHEKEG